MPGNTTNKTFSVKNGLSVANTVIIDTNRNLSNIATINANTFYSNSGINVIAQAATKKRRYDELSSFALFFTSIELSTSCPAELQ